MENVPNKKNSKEGKLPPEIKKQLTGMAVTIGAAAIAMGVGINEAYKHDKLKNAALEEAETQHSHATVVEKRLENSLHPASGRVLMQDENWPLTSPGKAMAQSITDYYTLTVTLDTPNGKDTETVTISEEQYRTLKPGDKVDVSYKIINLDGHEQVADFHLDSEQK